MAPMNQDLLKQMTELKLSQKIIRIITFMVILSICFMLFISVFKLKSHSSYILPAFYKEKSQTVDVFFLGSSRVYNHVNPAVLYTDHGIAAFNLAAGRQPPWSSYHYLLEGLKTQTPKLVVLETSCMDLDKIKFISKKADIVDNTLNYKSSINKTKALLTIIPKDEFLKYFFAFYHYHGRYASLAKQDFRPYMGEETYRYYKGFKPTYGIQKFDKPDVANMVLCKAMPPESEEYYRKIIELCQKKDISVLIMASPFTVNSDYMSLFNETERIAKEYNAPFINFNHLYDEIGLDFQNDMVDRGHMRYTGSLKFSRFLGQYLQANYNLPDRRVDAKWNSWAENAEYFWQEMAYLELRSINQWPEYLAHLKGNDNYTMIISISGKCFQAYPEIKDILQSFGINKLEEGTWVVSNNGVELFDGQKTTSSYVRLGSFCFDLSTPGNVQLNGKSYGKVKDGLNIVVYNQRIDVIADNIGLDANKNLIITRK